MTDSELWAYVVQLDDVIAWCECDDLRALYEEERARVNVLRHRAMMASWLDTFAEAKRKGE